MTRIAVLDDWQGVARTSADWSALERRAQLEFFEHALGAPQAVAERLSEFEILLAMRERTAFPAEVIARLPKLRMIAVTGYRTRTLDVPACTAHKVLVCHTGQGVASVATAELTLGLLLAAARHLPRADGSMRSGAFQAGVPPGEVLEGRTLGILGLGKIGSRMARYGQALGMRVLAWSPNLTEAAAAAAGATRVDKATLLAESDALSVHLVLSERSRGILGADDLARMKAGAILVNTSRGPLIDEAALVAELRAGRLVAALDVYDEEPLPPDHPLRGLPNAVLSPHFGYCVRSVYEQFYRESIENVLAFLDGKPLRVLNPELLA